MYIAADRRVLRRLVDAVRLYGENEAGQGTEVPLTQEELAQLAGTSRATVNKVLREMEDRGALELRRGRAIVLDVAALVRRGGPG
jgi:CRP-like cAMP-binding protein